MLVKFIRTYILVKLIKNGFSHSPVKYKALVITDLVSGNGTSGMILSIFPCVLLDTHLDKKNSYDYNLFCE